MRPVRSGRTRRDPGRRELPPLEQAEKRVERLKHEREQLGGVNLRAEEEAAEQETRLTTWWPTVTNLTGAIDRLRRGIQSLNREGRETTAGLFEKVNAKFPRLFIKAVRGRRSQADLHRIRRPLEAGLEIFARRRQAAAIPRPAVGGEQALTAMALIFAVSW